MGLPARADLVLRFGLEIASIMALVQLFFRRPACAVDHSPALNGRASADFFRPACQVFIFVRLQERARVVVEAPFNMPLPYHGQIAISAIVYSSPAMN